MIGRAGWNVLLIAALFALSGDPCEASDLSTVDLGDKSFTAEDVVRALAPVGTEAQSSTSSYTRGLRVIPTEQAGAAAVKPDQQARRSISMQLQFDFDSARLTGSSTSRLDTIGMALQYPELREIRFVVSGHTDSIGRSEYNLSLSQRRAEAVREYLTSRHGIEAERILAVGKGADDPADPSNPRSAVNRRVRLETLD